MFFIKNNKTEFKIVYNSDLPTAEFSASELDKYLKLSTNCSLLVINGKSEILDKAFYIGICKDAESKSLLDKTDLNGDGFILDISERAIYLTAKTGRGLIFGVYRFLEEFLGVRFFNMGCEKVPKNSNVELPEKLIIEKPDFAMRSYLNGKMLTGIGEEYDIYHLKQKMCNEHRHLPEKLGGECLMYGRGGTHNMCNFVPQEKYMETHPEFYAVCARYTTIDLLNGITDDGKLDESMDISVAKIVIEEMKKDIIANPQAMFFQFEQEDSDTYPRYEEGSHKAEILAKYGRSGILVRFCNMMATELQKWADKELNGRKIYFTTFAYGYTKNPPIIKKDGKIYPIDETVVPCDNLIIRMALFSNCAYDYFDKNQTEINEQIEGWRAICNKFMFWAYDTDFVSFIWYFPSLYNIKRNIEGFKEIGVKYLMFESADYGTLEWQAELKAYIYGQLMWNKNQSVNKLFDEYLQNFYGPASEYVKKAMAIMENYSRYVRSIYDNYIVCTFRWTYRHFDVQSEPLCNRVLDLLEQAEQAIINSDAENKEQLSVRLACVKVTFLHMKINKINGLLRANIEKSGVTRFSGDEDIPKDIKQGFYNVEMVHGVKEPVIIPDDVKQKIIDLDVYSIPDTIDLDV